MPRDTRSTRGGYIFLPKDMDVGSWKVEITSGGTTRDVTDYVIDGSINMICTNGVSNFTLAVDNSAGLYQGIFSAGDIVDIYYDYVAFASLSTVRFRGYIDGVFDNYDGTSGFTISIEGRDCPSSTNNEHFVDTFVTLQFTGRNNLECWAGVSGAVDDEGNYEDGVLYNSGLILQVYDDTSNQWKTWKDLTDSQKSTLKAQTSYTQTHTATYVDSSRLKISGELAKEGDYDFYIYYNSSNQNTYLRVFPEESVVNRDEYVSHEVNLISINRYGSDTSQEANRVKVIGKTDSNILLFRRKGDSTRQSALWIKDKVETEASFTTDTEVSNRATARVNELKVSPSKGTIQCCALPSLKPGEKIMVRIPYILTQQVKIKSFNVAFGAGVGLEFNSLSIQEYETDFARIFKDRIDETTAITTTDNPNGMTDSLVFDFSVEDDYTLSSCQIENDILSLESGETTGTCSTDTREMDDNVTQCELRIKANQYWNCTYRVTNNGGLNWESITPGTLHNFSTTGSEVKVEITLNEPQTGVSPEFDKVNLLVK